MKNVKDRRGYTACCHPRPLLLSSPTPIGDPVFGGALFGKTRDDTQVVPWCLCVGAGLGARPSFLFSCGVSAPHDEVLLFRQKDPKPVAPGRGPQEGVPVPRSLVCGLRNSLRSDSPRRHMEGTGPRRSPARRRREGAGGGICLFCHARLDRASSLLSSPTSPSVIPDSDRGSRVLGVPLFGKTRDDTQVVPYGIMVSVCRGGPGCPPFLSFLLWGFAPTRREGTGIAGFRPHTTRGRGLWGFGPTRRGPFVSAKGPKTSGARAGPPQRGCLCPGPWCVGCGTRYAQTVLATKWHGRDRGTAPPAGAGRRHLPLLSSPTPIGDPGFWGFRYLERRGTTRRSSPTGSWCLCVGAGLGARPSFLFSCGVSAPHDEGTGIAGFRPRTTRGRGLWGFGPTRRGPFVSAKGPKTSGARAWPPEGVPVPRSLVCGLRNSLRSDSPRHQMAWTGPGRSPARRRRDNCKE